ncbi:molybdenum ABC transporter ATP-binding protein [Chitinimonas sp. BJB300]|uniref:molybdenum ABC transporter ATP-binding protein n=1 Tax=Chitinimonas sp. BJB300 TaxID=1559339 RepID=UPI000C0E2EA0|nr:molybdenum ABC transporter ATP-binding protein [Chitinimonas sp. BJB300]PHV11122.1 molybdenum ABC transporter ATP-binding protein [Chitinimonas sp. BJB300]TSJ90990.1 molybdenum ABC transporter ATP-binding protein [Chitinimonas sp. BJB300]
MSLHAYMQLKRGPFCLDAEFALPDSGITVLFGPSGSGKTTLMRCLAGLELEAKGQIQQGDTFWQDSSRGIFLPCWQRGIGMVFQDAQLFPHLNVRGNLAFGYQRTSPAARKIDLQHTIDLLDLAPLLAHRPPQLSGGERQRVAIARALLTSPSLLLLDEPLAALDQARKQEILPYLAQLQQQLDLPMVYITHAMDEVSRLADYLVLLNEGKVQAQGELSATLSRPDLPSIFDEELSVILETERLSTDTHYKLARLGFRGGELLVPDVPQQGTKRRVRILARDVSLACSAHSDISILNRLPATVRSISPASHPAHVLISLDIGGSLLLARITHYSLDKLGIAPGSQVWAQIKSVALL